MKKGVKKLLSILLTAALLVSLLQGIPMFASAAMDDGNFIFNHGNAASVSYMGGSDLAATTKPSATKFGSAIALVPQKVNGSGWAKIPAKTPSNFDFSATNGIAMYVKFPSDVKLTNNVIRIINDGWSQWYQAESNVEATLVDKDGKVSKVTWSLPFENMQGYEGYVFIPYTSFPNGAHDSNDPRDLLMYYGWNIEIYYNKWDATDVKKEHYFDQMGFYSDIESYIALSEKEAVDANYVVNNGTTSGLTSTYGASLTVEAAANATKLGDAIAVSPTLYESGAYSGDGWVQIPADVAEADFDFSSTNGIAMYVKIPEGMQNSDFRVRIIRKDWADGSWWATNINRNIYYATVDGMKISENVRAQWEPFEVAHGYEGFVFIPWDSMDSNGNIDKAVIDPSILNGSDWQIEINFYDTDSTRVGKTWYFDEIGFYNTIDGYISEAADFSKAGNQVFNSGDSSDITATVDDVVATEVEGVSPYGTALNIKPTKIQTSGWVKVKAAVTTEFDFTKAAGIAAYIKLDANTPTIPHIRLINSEWSSWMTLNVGGAVTLYANGSATESTWALENLKGFEGFVFMPFTSFNQGTINTGINFDSYNWNIEVGYWSADEMSYQVDYIFDEIGFYSDIDIYRSMATGITPTGNHIFNSGDASNVEVLWKVAGAPVATVAPVKEASATGDMISINPNGMFGGGLAHIPAAVNEPALSFDMKAVKGVAMYVKFPNVDCNQSFMDMRIMNNALNKWYSINYGVIPLTLVALDGTVTEVSVALHTQNVLEGFEGFMFIPLSAFAGVTGADLNATDWNLEIGYYAKSESSAAATYLFDEFGFYSDVEEYIELVKSTRIKESLNVKETEDGNYITVTDDFDIAGNVGALLGMGTEGTIICGDEMGDDIAEDAELTTGYTVGVMTEDDYLFYYVVRYGDVNSDFNTDIKDLIRIKKAVAGAVTLEPASIAACTENGESTEITATELAAFKQMLLNK